MFKFHLQFHEGSLYISPQYYSTDLQSPPMWVLLEIEKQPKFIRVCVCETAVLSSSEFCTPSAPTALAHALATYLLLPPLTLYIIRTITNAIPW